MTAQHDTQQDPENQPTTTEATDPLGPIILPKRTKVGARALALVGTVGLSAVALASVVDGCITWTTINPN
ncbi:hypothetical protein [Kribbella sp. NPDC055071]